MTNFFSSITLATHDGSTNKAHGQGQKMTSSNQVQTGGPYPPRSNIARATEFAARGKVIKASGRIVVFAPVNTNYELHLESLQPYQGPLGESILVAIRAQARKIYTVPSGGGFITPLFGPPRIVQGRALDVRENSVVVRAGVPITVQLPVDDDAMDLSEGPIAIGALVNAVILPGATIRLLTPAEVAAK
jgi:hypothetical protein